MRCNIAFNLTNCYRKKRHRAEHRVAVFITEPLERVLVAARTGVEDIDVLTTMLIQADRFGTSIGDSLRVYTDGLRTKRRMKAEEQAAKIALKLLFPLIFFIFPTLVVVLVGPAAIQIYRQLLPTMSHLSGG